MKTDESLYLDFPALDPTVILALAQDVPTWKEDAVVEASLRDMLAGLNESAQTEAAVAALDLEEQQLQKQGGDGSSDQSLAEDFHWPEELEFLHHVCPNKSQHSLVRALRQNEGDLENTLNQISAEELSSFNDDESIPSSSASGAQDHHPDQSTTNKSHRKNKRRKEAKKTTFSLTSTPKGVATSLGNSHNDELASNSTDQEASLSHLATLMDTSIDTVTKCYANQRQSLVLAVECLLDAFERSRPFDKLSFDPPLQEQIEGGEPAALEVHPVIVVLLSLFPDQTDLTLWRRLLCGSNGRLEAAVDLRMVQQELAKQHGSVFQNTLLQAAADPTRYNINPLTRPNSTKKGWADVGARKPEAPTKWIDVNTDSPLSYASATVDGSASSAANPSLSATECATRAQEFRDQRNAAYKSASDTFARGKHNMGMKGQGMRAAAAYLAERGRELDALARKWDSAAAQSLVSERQSAIPYLRLESG